jgi:hypothetical protein
VNPEATDRSPDSRSDTFAQLAVKAQKIIEELSGVVDLIASGIHGESEET